MSYKQWLDILRGKPVEKLDKFPVSPEVRKKMTVWLQDLDARFSLDEDTETLVQDIINARFGSKGGGTDKAKGKAAMYAGDRMEVFELDLD